MPIAITVVFDKISEALNFFEKIMTTDALEFNKDIQIAIDGEKEDMDEFHEAMTQTVIDDMLTKTEKFLGEQDNNGS